MGCLPQFASRVGAGREIIDLAASNRLDNGFFAGIMKQRGATRNLAPSALA
jgi:hypothetical protein